MEPGDDVAIQPVTCVPPFELAVKGTVAVKADSDAAVPTVGAVGVVQVVIEFDAAEAGEVPAELEQLTVNV